MDVSYRVNVSAGVRYAAILLRGEQCSVMKIEYNCVNLQLFESITVRGDQITVLGRITYGIEGLDSDNFC